jgi:hypothetical protein
VFRDEVVRAVVEAPSLEEALLRLEARGDVVGAVRASSSRVLLDSILRSEELQDALSDLLVRQASELRPATVRWMGRYSALVLEGALRRSAESSGRFMVFHQTVVRTLPSVTILNSLLSHATFGALPMLAQSAEGLLLCVLMATEQPAEGDKPASPVVKGLVSELWRAVYRHERALLAWLVASLQASSPTLLRLGPFPSASAPAASSPVRVLLDELLPSLEVGAAFSELRQEWHAATGHLANPAQIVAHPAYRAIIELGWPVMPFILRSLEERGPDFWGPALYELTGEEPPLPAGDVGTVEGIGNAWLALARKRGWRIGGGHAG